MILNNLTKRVLERKRRRKQSRSERLEKKRIAERERIARIKRDPKLYEAFLLKKRERAAKKFIPLNKLPPKQMALKRKRKKEYNKHYYRKLKLKRKAEFIDSQVCTLLGV